jgi:hypothetical protein
LLTTTATSVLAQANPKRSGTAEEQRACAPDVSRLCRDVMNDSDLTILGCLKANRAKVSAACDKVLVSNGQ